MANDGMMQFRVAYLRAIAWAWQSTDNYAEMVKVGPDDGLRWLAKWYDGEPAFAAWSIGMDFAPDLLDGNGYHPDSVGRWVGPMPLLQFPVPKKPADDQGRDQTAEAVAAYYAALPTPFGPGTDGGGGGPGGQGMGPVSDALVLGATLMRTVSVYWNQPEGFTDEVLFNAEPPYAKPALANFLGYNCPWNMDLQAVKSVATWAPDRPGERGAWSEEPRAMLTLYVPRVPAKSDAYCEGFALAAYNETGAAYPLTCP